MPSDLPLALRDDAQLLEDADVERLFEMAEELQRSRTAHTTSTDQWVRRAAEVEGNVNV